jgi:pimeloyl-ACP methyl ester carboxylesterase
MIVVKKSLIFVMVLGLYGIIPVFLSAQSAVVDLKSEMVTFAVQESESSSVVLQRTGVLVCHPDAQATIIICHGFMCDKYDVGFIRCLFPLGKYNFLTFDFRAHGECIEGQCCTFGKNEALDVLGAARYVRSIESIKDKPLFVYGFSMGAVASIEAQAKIEKAEKIPLFDAMILDCPFDSSDNVLKKTIEGLKFSIFGYEFPMPGRDILQRYAFHPHVQRFIRVLLKTIAYVDMRNVNTYLCPLNPVESVKNITVPCFFIHCKNDEKISIASVRSVYEGASGYKRLWITDGRRHFDSLFYNPEVYSHHLNTFLSGVLVGSIKTDPVTAAIIED